MYTTSQCKSDCQLLSKWKSGRYKVVINSRATLSTFEQEQLNYNTAFIAFPYSDKTPLGMAPVTQLGTLIECQN